MISSLMTKSWIPFPYTGFKTSNVPKNDLNDLNDLNDEFQMDVILDHFQSKCQAYFSAIEVSQSLSSIGKVLYV